MPGKGTLVWVNSNTRGLSGLDLALHFQDHGTLYLQGPDDSHA
jgi:hypothetical protein